MPPPPISTGRDSADQDFAARVSAAFRAASERLAGPLVRAAFFAAADRSVFVLFAAADRACFESASDEAAFRPSRCKAVLVARDRFAAGLLSAAFFPFLRSRFAASRVFSEVCPFLGGGSSTPARLALDKPIAIACLLNARRACLRGCGPSLRVQTRPPASMEPCPPLCPCALARCFSSPACCSPSFKVNNGYTVSFGLANTRKFSPRVLQERSRGSEGLVLLTAQAATAPDFGDR